MWSKLFGSKKGESKGEKTSPEQSERRVEEAPPRRRMPKITTTEVRPVAPKEETDPISLKAKVSTWESFFSLFSGDKSELSLYIPTEKQTRVREDIAIMLFTPTGKAVPLGGTVVHIFYDSTGKQIGVGVKLGKMGGDERFQELMSEAARHVNVPVAGPADLDDEIPIFVEDETPIASSRIGGPPKREPRPRHETRPAAPAPAASPPVQESGDGVDLLEGLDAAFDDLDPTPVLSVPDEERTGIYGQELPPSPEEQDGIATAVTQKPTVEAPIVYIPETVEPEAIAAKAAISDPPLAPGVLKPAASESNTLVGLGPDDRGGTSRGAPAVDLAQPAPSSNIPQQAAPPPGLTSVPTEAQVRAPSPHTFIEQRQQQRPQAAPQTFTRSTFVPIVGMDFGTTRSSVAVVVDDDIKVLQAQNGMYDIPSVVGFTAGGEAVVGTEARELLIIDPAHAISSPKRLLGRHFSDRELESFLAGLAINYSEAPNGHVLLHPRGKTYSIPQVCAPILFSLRLMAQEYLQQDVRQVVLSSPVSFDEERLQALEDAAALAGLEIVETVDEPTAAALAHHFDVDFKDIVAVYDFGGGTFDFSLVDVSSEDLTVVATAGDTWLGGDDFDLALANAAANAFWRRHQIEIRHQVVRWQRLLIAAEKAKRELSVRDDTILALPDAALTSKGPLALRCPVDEGQFRQLSEDLIERSLDTCREAMELAGISPEEVNAVYMSGGTSCIPAVREAVAAYFNSTPKSTISPERAVVMGTALVGAQVWESRVGAG